MNSNLSFEKSSSFINMTIYDICLYHNKKFEYYCKSCSLELCKFCINSHFNHDIINYSEFQPTKEEIETLKYTINKYEEDYNKFLSQIFTWKKFLDKIIIFFENQIKKNINFITNICDTDYINYNSIINFRIIFDNIISPQESINNKQILNYIIKDNNNNNIENLFYKNENKIGLFKYNNYCKMKMSLDGIIKNINNINDNFLINSNYILKILWENYNINKRDDTNNIININKNQNKKIVEKYIDLSINKRLNKNKTRNINLNNTQQLFNPKKIGNIFLENNYYNPLNVTNIFNTNLSPIYFKKRSNSNTNLFWNKNRKNISFNINEFNTNLSINKINLFLKNEKLPNKKKTFNNKRTIKTFIHKKYETKNQEKNVKNNISPKTPEHSSKSEKNKIKEKISFFNNTSGNKLNSTYNDSEIIKQKLNFDFHSNETIKNNEMNLLLNNDQIKDGEIIYKLSSDKIKYNKNIHNNEISNLETSKLCNSFKLSLSENHILCLGLEIGKFFCKLGFINQNTKNIFLNNKNPLNNLGENIFTIPFLLTFNEEKREIKFGEEAYDSMLNDSYTTIFDIMNFFGKNYDEIFFKKELYPYEIFSIENKPFIKINLNKKQKLFNFEDLFTIYMKKLFQKFFEKIEIRKNNNNTNNIIKIILVIAIPDNLNYFQRKIIEKIFQTQIFPNFIDNLNESSNNSDSSKSDKNNNKKLYNGYQIILKDIKIENSSSVIHLSNKTDNSKYNNNNNHILSIVSSGENIEITLSSNNKDLSNNEIKEIIEIKNEINIKKGENNIINDFIEQNLKLKENSPKDCDNRNNKLRKIYYEFIFNQNIIYYQSKELIELNKSLNNIYKEIISSIKSLLIKEKINLNKISCVLLNGQILKSKSFIELLSNLFNSNKEIQSQLNELINNNSNKDNNIILGTLIESFNLNLSFPFFILKKISLISFGVDSFGKMEFIIQKGNKIPLIKNKYVKIKTDKKYKDLIIILYEGENKDINKNRIISSIKIDKKDFKNEKIFENYIEILIQFELDEYSNLRVFILDPKTKKKRFECLINIDIIKK